MAKQTKNSQELHEQLDEAKETLNRLRCINGHVGTCCDTSKNCQGCQGHTHDITIGRCLHRDRKCLKDCSSMEWKGGELRSNAKVGKRRTTHGDDFGDRVGSHADSSVSRVDIQRLRRQIDSLEESVRGPILSYVERMEKRNDDMSSAVETIRLQLLKHERDCPAMSSGTFCDDTNALAYNSADLLQKLTACQKTEKETNRRAETLEKELEVCREKLGRSESRVKELFRNVSQNRQHNTGTSSGELLLQTQLQRQQQLAETYFKESTSKDREISFLTIEKYNLESEVSSLVADLESSNQKRNELCEERKGLDALLQESRKMIASLEHQLKESKSEFKHAKTQFRGVLEEERARGEKNSENHSWKEKEIKELRKKIKKYEDRRSSQKDIMRQLEAERDELSVKARSLNNEYKMKLSECKNLREENQRLTSEISGAQVEACTSKTENSNSKTYIENLKSELVEAKSSVKLLQSSVQESKVNESKISAEISTLNHKETTLRVLIEAAEKERSTALQELQNARKQEVNSKSEVTELKGKLEDSRTEIQKLVQVCASAKTELDVTREKYFQVKRLNDELVLSKSDVEKSSGTTLEELTNLKTRYEELSEKNGQLSADLKAYKRIIAEKEDQLKKYEFELSQMHKTKDKELKEQLKKDREIAFLKARVTSTERRLVGSSNESGTNRSETNLIRDQYASGYVTKDAEIYLERIVELESECKSQKSQLDELHKNQFNAKKSAERSESLKQELASQDEEIYKLRREVSQSKQVIEDLQCEKEQVEVLRDEKEKLLQEVARLQSKVEDVSELKQAYEKKEEEMRVLKRMTSDEVDLEGKVTRLKERCREKDEEIEELHQKVIALQVKIKDFMQQNSLVEEQIRSVKDKYAIELGEKENISQALKTAEAKCRDTETQLQGTKARIASLEKDAIQAKRLFESLEAEKDETATNVAQVMEEKMVNDQEITKLRQQVEDLEEKTKSLEEAAKENKDLPDGASTPLENSFGDSLRLSLGQSGRNSVALGRLEQLEEENIQLLNRQTELEDELDAAEEHAQELKSALKAKRENVNDLHTELDLLKEKLLSAEKVSTEMTDENEVLQRTQVLLQQKVDDLRANNERYMDESDEVEKALTAAEKKIEDLERKLEEISGKCAGSQGQLQSATERLARKDKELAVVETQVEEQRKLCDGYKSSAERQETLVEKLRIEKATADETLLALKLEMAKKEGTYKAAKEKNSDMQARLYETEDKFSGKVNECKKLGRENERLKREIKEMEIKLSDLQSIKKKQMSVDIEKSSGPYSTKFTSLNTSLKGNTQNVEGLDNKLNSAQNKIATLEVALANDVRRFSLRRTSSDSRRSGYSPSDNLSPSTGNLIRPNSSLSTTSDFMDDNVASPYPRDELSTSLSTMVEFKDGSEERADLDESQNEGKTEGGLSEVDIFQRFEEKTSISRGEESGTNISIQDKQGEYGVDDTMHSYEANFEFENVSFGADPNLSNRGEESLSSVGGTGDCTREDCHMSEEMVKEACEIFCGTSTVEETSLSQEPPNVVQEEITCCSAPVTGYTIPTVTQSSNEGEEELIYF